MSNFKYFNIFANYQKYLEKDQELREVNAKTTMHKKEHLRVNYKNILQDIIVHYLHRIFICLILFQKIRVLVRNIEQYAKEATIKLQIMHCDLSQSNSRLICI